LMMPISPMINTTFPEITRSIVTKKWTQLKQMLRRVTYLSGGWTVFVTAFMLVFGKWIISLAYGADFVPAYSVLMILLAGFGISNIFFWNRTLLLSFGKANIPLYVLFGAAVLKILLAFLLVPMYGINAEAALLSGNFALSVGLLVWIGLTMVKRAEKLDTLETA
jgi:O-antigen/teichoic acid export membrane protein